VIVQCSSINYVNADNLLLTTSQQTHEHVSCVGSTVVYLETNAVALDNNNPDSLCNDIGLFNASISLDDSSQSSCFSSLQLTIFRRHTLNVGR